MTISTTASAVTVAGNGLTTSFNWSFVYDSASNIVVTFTDANSNATVLVQGSQYTLSLNPPAAGQIWGVGGTVTYPLSGPPIPAGTYLTITRELPLTQLTSISNQGNFYPQVVEKALDLLEMQIQEVEEQASRALLFNPADQGPFAPLPISAVRAGKILGFDSTGNPAAFTELPAGSVSSAMAPVVEAASTTEAIELLGVSAAMLPVVGASTTDDALAELGFDTGIPKVIVTGASPGQTLAFAIGNGGYNGGTSMLTDNSSAAFFTGSISGNTLTVTVVTSGFIGAALSVIGSGVTQTTITAQLSGVPGGVGTYSVDISQSVPSTPMQAYTFSTALTGYGILNQPGGQMFGIFGRADLNVAGVAVNELDSFNNTGINPTSSFPPNPAFGTTDHIAIALQLVAFGNAQSKVGLWITAPTAGADFQAGIYISGGAASLFGIGIGATGTIGPLVGLDIASVQTGVAAQFRLEGAPDPSANIVIYQNPGGGAIGGVHANGDVWNAGFSIGSDGVLRFITPATATSAGGGSASALPAAPAGYLDVEIAGVVKKIPFYN